MFDKIIPRHWDTEDGTAMANRSLGETRDQLCHGEMSDLALANAVYMASRTDLDLIVYQTAAKERIRWLSAHLAAANERIAHLENIACLADELLMSSIGAFPLPGHPLRDDCLLVRWECGDDYHERKRKAALARPQETPA